MILETVALLAHLQCAQAQEVKKPEEPPEPKKIELGYNALEVGAVKEMSSENDDAPDVRTRLLTDIDFRVGNKIFGAWGLHEGEPGNTDSYSGRDALTYGSGSTRLPDGTMQGQRAAVVVKTDSTGVLDTKFGVRDYDLPGAIGDYGWLDVTADFDALNAALFVGKEIGKGSVEFLHEREQPRKGKPWHYTELQVNAPLSERVSLYGRAESSNFRRKETRFIAGISMKR